MSIKGFSVSGVTDRYDYNYLDNKPEIHNVPTGGTAGQVLAKTSGADYAVGWVNQTGGGGGGDTIVDSALSTTSENPVQNKAVTTAINAKYAKPAYGIPATDMTSAVQASLAKADTALQTAPVTSVNGQTGDVTVQAATDAQVTTAVNTWLGNNVAQETGYVLDSTLTMNNAAAPADKVGDLKTAITQYTGNAEIQFSDPTLKQYINTSGSTVSWDNPSTSVSTNIKWAVVECSDGDKFTINGQGGNSDRLWAFADASKNILSKSVSGATASNLVITAPKDATYLIVNDEQNKKSYIGEFLVNTVSGLQSEISDLNVEHINRFNKSTISNNKYVNAGTGELVDSNSFFASDYIDISDLSAVACCKTHIIAFYDSSKAYISGQAFNTINSDNSVERPANAYYMRFSTYKTHLDTAQVGASVTSANYVPYSKYTLPLYVPNDNTIIVDASGNGNYTSLTEALYENVESGATIVVKPGTYDLHAEYITKWGASAVDNMADADAETFNGFQFGAIIRNRKVIFEAGSRVVCDFTYQSDGVTPQVVNGSHRICAFRVDYNAEIVGLDLTVAHVFYAIHDDYGLLDTPYTNKYENCRIVGSDITNANCIGGGCKKYSRHILNNCYFDNGNQSRVSVRYHNSWYENAVPEVYIYNCYFNSSFVASWYGPQTTKMKVYVNNCHATSIFKKAEDATTYDVDNVELFKWCNEETGS